MKLIRRFRGLVFWTVLILFNNYTSLADPLLNSWTKSSDGKWEEPFWSLNVLPGIEQSVLVSNSGTKTLEISTNTALSFSTTLEVQNLSVDGQTEILVNSLGNTREFRIFDTLRLTNGGGFTIKDSDVFVGKVLRVTGGNLSLDGGELMATNSAYVYNGGIFNLTNGVFTGSGLALIYEGTVNQWGGQLNVGQLRFVEQSDYNLFGGSINASTDVFVSNNSNFEQQGGKIITESLAVGPTEIGKANFHLGDGLIQAKKETVFAGYSEGKFFQSGGTNSIEETLLIQGSARYAPAVPIFAFYQIDNGFLSAGSLNLDGHGGFSSFAQNGGIVTITNLLELNNTNGPFQGSLYINSGELSVSTVTSGGAGASITQHGGKFTVTNQFSFYGIAPPSGPGQVPQPAIYYLNDGRFSARDIELGSEMIVGNSESTNSNRINNSGTFAFNKGTLKLMDGSEKLGKLRLISDATIEFGGEAKLGFEESASETWEESSHLVIRGWKGSLQGNGKTMVTIGTSSQGLTTNQLGKISFINPAGLPSGFFGAKVLASGEIVPDDSNALLFTAGDGQLILSWKGERTLQSSKFVEGPYHDMNDAESPFSVTTETGTSTFYRLR